ncbi:MAG: SDR family NAD(P)-dependent oxidoreductase [Gammaproteobacteria bacterium]|nr:SDR family NAD(P)-dependent oxidoreductase [Gammaproteobacteria bacterium]
MTQKSILITGCSSGIGLCCAQGLKQRGWRVFATARKDSDVDMLRSLGLEAHQLDLDDSSSIQRAFAWVLQQTGGTLDALFNNGAYGLPGAVEDVRREDLRALFETNFFGPHELTCLALPVMRRQGHGRIVQNSSILGFAAMPFRGAYNASKFALEGLTDTLRIELHDTNIRISLIEPGPITSRFRANAFAMYQKHINKETSPFRRKYESMEARLKKKGPAVPFTLPPEAVLAKLIHALESNNPNPRYYVTTPTIFFGYLKRFLSTRIMDKILLKASGDGNR